MDSDSLQSEFSALRKLYRLLQINGSSEPSSISEILDEESRVLLRKLLEDASERVFEAHMKIMADKWRSLLGTQCLDQPEGAKGTEISQPSTSSLATKSPSFDQNWKENAECHSMLQNNEQPLEIKMPNNAPVVSSRLRRSATELQNRKKRCLPCEQGSKLEGLNPLNDDEKQSSESVRYSGVLNNQRTSVIDCKSSGKESITGLSNKASNVEGFSKEVDDAIRRIESLIPSLHRLAKPVGAPTGKKTNSVLDLDAAGSSLGRQESVPRLLHRPHRSDYKSLKEEDKVKLLENTASQIPHLHGNASRNDNVAGQIPHHIQEMRILPSQFYEDNVNQYRVPQGEVRRKTPPSSSTNFRKAREGVDTRDSVRRENQVLPLFNESEETRSGSPGSSSWITGEASSSFSPSDTIQTTSSCTGENEDSGLSGSNRNYEDVESELSGTRYETSQTGSRYDTSSTNPSEYYESNHHSVRGRQAGKFKRLKNKLGLIFHHHHHHHHHHHDKGGQAHGSVWKHLGKMFRHTEKEEAKKPKAGTRNKDKHLAKSGSSKQQNVKNLHTFVEGLMKEVKKSKKPKQGEGGIENLGDRRLVGKKAGKKPSWCQKKTRVKVPGRDKKPRLKVPKSHLRQS